MEDKIIENDQVSRRKRSKIEESKNLPILVNTLENEMRVNGHHLIERKKKTLIDGPESGDSTTIIEIVRVIDNRTYKVTEHVKNGFMIGNESVETCMTEAEVRQFESDWSKYQKQIEQANVKLDLEWENHMERLRMEKCRVSI